MNIFTDTKITDHITRIDTPAGVCMYLITGTERALLIDTGMGIGDLKGHVEELTQLPYDVILTHGHCDHAGGAVQFPEVYLSKADWDLEKRHATVEHRIQDVFHGFHKPEGITEDMLLPQRSDPFLPLDESVTFSLGNVTVHFIAAPGHTRGSVIPVIPEDGAVILGDDCSENTLLHFPESVSVQEYKDSLAQVIEDTKDMTIFLNFHGTKHSDPGILKDEYALCEQIINGTDSRIPLNLLGYSAMSARPMKHPGFPGNIIYDPDKIIN